MPPPRGRVIVGVSGSLRNMAAVRAAAAVADHSGRPLIAVTIWQPPGGEQTARRAACPPLDRLARDDARRMLTAALAGLAASVEVEARVMLGRPAPALVTLADQPDDLLVVGAGRQGRFGRLTHGAVSRSCLAHARCPVLAVPEPSLLRELKRLHRRRRITVSDELVADLRRT